jgi:hypothetical protein
MTRIEWRSVLDGCYEVSSIGAVRRAKPEANTYPGKMLKVHVDRFGYASVFLYRNGVKGHYRVGRLVAEAWLGPCLEGRQVNHKDGVKGHDYPKNLEWVTPSENTRHAYSLGLATPQRNPAPGERNGNSKLTEENVKRIRKIGYKRSQMELSRMFRVSPSTIRCIRLRQNWTHI